MGTLDDGLDDITRIVDKTKDCQIFQQGEAVWGKEISRLEKYDDFGLYKSDCCSGKAWDQLQSYEDEMKGKYDSAK
eukprot:scaffold603_cov118-Cylindrotheca_fusiformis.AAC.4